MLSLKSLTNSCNSIICTRTAHIAVDECGAIEHATGCRLVTIDTPDGKLTPELIKPELIGFGFQHHAQPKVISISQTTELGTLYTAAEIKALADLAHSYGMFLHVDGSRISNAVVTCGISLKEMIVDTGVDVLSFGGTKNGMMIGEAVIFFDPKNSKNSIYYRKQIAQLYSKMRFVAAQFEAYLSDNLWLRNAQNSNRMARLLVEKVSGIQGVEVTQGVTSNAVFAIIPSDVIEKLSQKYFFYVWDENKGEVRWMTAFDTTEDDIEKFVEALKECLRS